MAATRARGSRAPRASTKTSSGRSFPSSPPWSAHGIPRRSGSASTSSRSELELAPRAGDAGDLRARGRASSTSARPSSSPPSSSRSSSCRRVRKTKTGYSTDADVLEQLALGHELPAKIIEHRTLAKLKSTYADSLPDADQRRARAHPPVVQPARGGDGTACRRAIRTLQNIPIRTELGRRIRAAFVPEAGLALPRRRLLADRAAHPRPRLRRGEPRSRPSGAARTSTGAPPPRSFGVAARRR